jgi:hypothetical protein
MVFVWFFGLDFPICSMILSTPIPIVFFLGFPTWGFHNHFVEVRYMIGGRIEKNIVYFGSPSRSSFYNNSPP